MAKDNSGLGSCVVVVGDPDGELAQTVGPLARAAGIDAMACDDVYAAVTQIAKAADRRILIAGRIQDLARENGSFFRIAAARAIRCCCLLDKPGPTGRAGDLQRDLALSGPRTQDLLVAVRAGATVLSGVQDLRDILDEWLATARRHDAPRAKEEPSQTQRRARDAGDASYEDLRATEAELSALLR